MYGGLYQSQNAPDPLDEFLSQILLGFSSDLPAPIIGSTYVPTPPPAPPAFQTEVVTLTPASAPASAQIPASATALPPSPLASPPSPLTCNWVSSHNPPHICGAPISPDQKRACWHLRQAHNIRGNDKTPVGCGWYACRAAPMQRGSLIRHILAVHLGLLRWRCEGCGRMFSRKGTGHACEGRKGSSHACDSEVGDSGS